MNADNPSRYASDSPTPTWLLELLDRFQAAWQQGLPPRLEDFLPSAPEQRRAALLPLLTCDLQRRLGAGLTIRVEDYLLRFPELAESNSLLKLITLEHQLLCQQAGVTLTDYLRRFPHMEGQLREHLVVADATIEQTASAGPGGPATTGAGLPPLRYRPLQLHDKGNLGEVLRAQDEELHREVALKRIQAHHADNAESRRRFLREAEITGRLEHPGVVPVYGLGEDSDGRPAYAMRFIHGESLATAIKRFHAADQPGRDAGERRLALRQLLTGFVTVCKTMAYAHSRGILHRDLKPANIMLGKYGETLVVDWGLAKAFERDATAPFLEEESLQPMLAGGGGETQEGQMVGTPAFSSPEQAAGRWDIVGPASDIFSLGAVLYNLLTNRLAYAGPGVLEILGQVSQGEIIPPRQRQKDIPRPLEAICLKAMARQREDRYATALDLAADVEHWLADEPVEAYREPALVRAGRWLRQHRVLVAGLVAAAAVALVSLSVVVVVVAGKNGELHLANQREAARAEGERLAKEEAEKRLVQIEKGTDLLGSIFANLDPNVEEKEGKPLGEILGKRVEATAAQLQGESIGDTLTVAKLQNILGESLIGLGHSPAAEALLEKSTATRAAQLGDDHLETLESRNNLARAYHHAGQLKRALPLFEQTLKAREAQLGDDHPDTLTSRSNLAMAYEDAGQLKQAIPLFERTLQRREAKLGDEHPETLQSRGNLANAYLIAGQMDRAVPLLEHTLKAFEAKLGEDHPYTLTTRDHLARAYQTAGKLELAIPLYQRTLKAFEAKLGDDHPSTLASRNNLAVAYHTAGQPELAIPLHERILKARQAKVGDDHPDTLVSRNNLAMAYKDAGQEDRAIPLFQRTLQLKEAKLGADHPSTLATRNNLAGIYKDIGKVDLAIPLYQRNLQACEAQLGKDHPHTLLARNNLARAYQAAGQLDRALPILEDTLKARQAKLGDDHPDTLASRRNLAIAYQAAKRLDLAIPLFDQVVPQAQKKMGLAHPWTRQWIHDRIVALEADHQFSRAVQAGKEMVAAYRKQLASDDPHLAAALALLGRDLLAAQQPGEAESVLRECLTIRAKKEADLWTTFDTQSLLGAALLAQKSYAEAEPLLLKGYDGLKQRHAKIAPRDKVRLSEALERLVQLYEALAKKDDAAKWRKELDKVQSVPPKTP
jgi:lipopolysaccharide biosynthesis regulator YciM/tRNA A-37 threonylcarbamoyl transferase component Bud32